jgi:hypothetical protein
LLYLCTLLQNQREILKKEIIKHRNWPISKHYLITKHLKSFLKFTNSIESDKLWRRQCNSKKPTVYHTMVIHCKGMQRQEQRQTLHPLKMYNHYMINH